MESIKNILGRLSLYYDVSNNRRLSEKMNINYNTINTWIKRDTIPYDKLRYIVQKESMSFDWLLTGKGEMLLKEENTSQPPESSSNSYAIDMLSIKASAGAGIEHYQVEIIDKLIIDKAFFRTTPNPNKLKIIEVYGDSMEPTIPNGAFVIIDESQDDNIDGVYAIMLDDRLMIKRLQFNIDGTIKIISDNTKYDIQIYNSKETQIFFKIIGRKIPRILY